MKQFGGAEITRFLKAVDRHAEGPFRIVVIGGAAAALSYGARGGTIDIDTASNVAGLQGACAAARKETGLDLPVGFVPIAESPWEYESRLRRVAIRGLRKLNVWVPEKHDWALTKITRLLEKDIEDILEVSGTAGFDKSVFLKRFIEEMTHIEPRVRLVRQFLAMMEELYGEAEADRMEEAIRRSGS